MTRGRRHGFTLVELLAVLAIIAVLAGLLFPVLASVKGEAKDAVSISNLHQLGIASGLYHDETGEFPGSATLLYPSYVRDRRLFRSPNDETPHGYAVLMLGTRPRIGPDVGDLTYVGANEAGRTAFLLPYVKSIAGTTRGLFADLSPLKNQRSLFSPVEGHYHRLTEGLSVVSVQLRYIQIEAGSCFVSASVLDDYDESFLRDQCKL